MKKAKAFIIFCLFLIVLPGMGYEAQAETWIMEQPEPFLPGTEEIRLLLEENTICQRANAFSQGESIAESAFGESGVLTIRLSRPLNAGEKVRVLLEGTDSAGIPLFFDHVWDISRYGALKEEANQWRKQWDALLAEGEQTGLEEFMRSYLPACLRLAPAVEYDPTGMLNQKKLSQ